MRVSVSTYTSIVPGTVQAYPIQVCTVIHASELSLYHVLAMIGVVETIIVIGLILFCIQRAR
jgi:hypothetical protein